MKEGVGIARKLLVILFTMIALQAFFQIKREPRWHKEIIDLVFEQYSDQVFNTVIRRNPRLAEVPSFSQSILVYAPGSSAAKQYLSLIREIRERCSSFQEFREVLMK